MKQELEQAVDKVLEQDHAQVDFGDPAVGTVVAYRLVIGDMAVGPFAFFTPEDALVMADEVLGTHAAETVGDITGWNPDDGWTGDVTGVQEMNDLIMATARTQAEPARAAAFFEWDRDFWLVTGPPNMTEDDLFNALDGNTARQDFAFEIN